MLKIIGTGAALPRQRLSSAECDRRLGKPQAWLEREIGVRERPVIGPDETQITLAVDAARQAIAEADIATQAIDLIISACGVGYQAIPGTAPLIMRELGLRDGTAAAFDINATCLSFVAALDMAAALIAGGRYRTALIVSADIASRALPWNTRPDIAGLFGDGAGAAVVINGNQASGLVAAKFRTYPSGYELCQIGAGGTRFDFDNQPEEFAAHSKFTMQGKELFRLTSKCFGVFVDELLAEAEWRRNDVDLVVPHQASPFALAHMVRQLGFAPGQFIDITATHGNQIAASIPIALDRARRERRIMHGSRVLLLGTSAGISFGGAALVL